jgi:multidrug transporter EmrE-like cation transporter
VWQSSDSIGRWTADYPHFVVFALYSGAQFLFYSIRISLVCLKMYLDTRQLQYFVRSMNASTSLLASTYNQCFAILLAGMCGMLLFSESLSMSWMMGAGLILAGVCCVQWGQSEDKAQPAETNQTEAIFSLDWQAQSSESAPQQRRPHTRASRRSLAASVRT